MDTDDVASCLRVGLLLWLGLLAALVIYRFATNPQRLRGLLATRTDTMGAGLAADRVQLLGIFLVVAASYVVHVLHAVRTADAPLTAMPDIPNAMLSLMAGSQTLYLGGKLSRIVNEGGR